MKADLLLSVPIKRTPRLQQLEGMFDLSPAKTSTFELHAELPLEQKPWSIGLIVGPSGCGKSSLARKLFGADLVTGFDWPASSSLVDAFPEAMSIKDVAGLLSSVGFSSPPAWLRPFAVLSNGEQFRVTVARALAEAAELVVIDEFTSVVDRTVAQIGSAAVAKAVRRVKKRFVAVSCHYDVIDWLQPDWIYEPAVNAFQWRSLQRRPEIRMEIVPALRQAWGTFSRHHYLSHSLGAACKCFVALVDGQPAAFTAVMSFAHPVRPGWREHRTVCLPDFQGVGIGNAMSEFVAGLYRATGKPYRSVTSHPAMIRHRARSPRWKMIRGPGLMKNVNSGNLLVFGKSIGARASREKFLKSGSIHRLTASFEFVGPARQEARTLGVV